MAELCSLPRAQALDTELEWGGRWWGGDAGVVAEGCAWQGLMVCGVVNSSAETGAPNQLHSHSHSHCYVSMATAELLGHCYCRIKGGLCLLLPIVGSSTPLVSPCCPCPPSLAPVLIITHSLPCAVQHSEVASYASARTHIL